MSCSEATSLSNSIASTAGRSLNKISICWLNDSDFLAISGCNGKPKRIMVALSEVIHRPTDVQYLFPISASELWYSYERLGTHR